MKRGLVALSLLALVTSCLKKIDGSEALTTNVFDKDYTGECWFLIEDAYQFYNDFGFPKVRVKGLIPSENLPGLTPTLIYVSCNVNGGTEILFNSTVNPDGDYTFYYDSNPFGSGEYCLDAGIYLQEEDTVINRFTLCKGL